MGHAEMVRDGATRYIKQLRALQLPERLRVAADAIAETIGSALRLGASLDANSMPFTFESLAKLNSDDKASLHNPYLIGYGDPSAPLIIVGTEHAFEFDHPRLRGPSPDACFAMADCALHALWLADGGERSGELAERLSGQKPAGPDILAGHRHPYEFLYPIPAGHMWRRLSHMITATGIALQQGAAPRWGSSAYMFELSDTAAAKEAGGALPSAARQQFLPSILASLEEARVLVFHGRWGVPSWDAIRESLAAAFLREPHDETFQPTWSYGPTKDYRSATAADGLKLVVIMQSPTRFGPTNAFLDGIGKLIAPYCE
jgi:hypothetical protein